MGSVNTTILMSARRVGRWAACPVILAFVSGCSTMGVPGSDASTNGLSFKNISTPWGFREPAYDQVAENLVNSLVQIPQLNPSSTAIQFPPSNNAFDIQLRAALVGSGYEIKPESDNDALLSVGSEVKKTSTVAGRHRVFGVSVGPVSIARAYAVVDGSTVPVTSQLITGTEAQAIEVNDELFGSPDRNLASVEFQTPGSDENVRVMPVAFVKAKPNMLAANDLDARRRNYFDTGQSNYDGVFDEYEDVSSAVLVFPNDSLRLGNTNKAIIEKYVSSMDPDTDVLSVIGCSLGATSIENGNSLLAIGRANRVKEAFMFSGLEHDQVMEEGCWAPEVAAMQLPARGVVVTLKRQKN